MISTNRRPLVTSLPLRVARVRFVREMVLVGGAYMLYELVRSLSAGRAVDAFENAQAVVGLERALGIFAELNVQVAFLGWGVVMDFLSLWYFWGHFPLMIIFALWAFHRHRRDYSWARNAIFAAGAIGLVLYLVFPVAPPRLVPGGGFVDTLRGVFALQYDDSSLVNQFAAVPSLHQGFAVIVGVALYRIFGGRKGLLMMAVLPVLMMVSIVATGNHWWLDAILGAVVAIVGMGIATQIELRGPRALRSVRRLVATRT
jgi:membrane-associated phospholipid phosphatase